MDGTFSTSPRLARVFESSLRVHSRNSPSFDDLIGAHLEQVARDLGGIGSGTSPTPPSGPFISDESANLLREMGDYFTRTAQMWSAMTHNLLQGPHIDQVAVDVTERSQKYSLGTDLDTVTAADVEITRLRKIRDLTAKFSQDVQAVWCPDASHADVTSPRQTHRSALPLSHILRPVPGHDTHLVTQGHHVNTGSAGDRPEHLPFDNEDDEDDSETDDEDLFAAIDMDALKQRGKGVYHCPKGLKCDKGGVDKAGNLVRFDRNSSFAQHCNKHRKPWVCDLDYCPNTPKKRRFARRDGLERHKASVRHEPKNAAHVVIK